MTDKALEAALPGEAEVVGWAYRGPRGGLIVTEEKPGHAPDAYPLVTLTSLQAMQARAEKAAEVAIPREVIDRYYRMVPATIEPKCEPEPGTSSAHIKWMLLQLYDMQDFGKAMRWLGFIQGILIGMRGYTTVKAERDFTRPFFAAAIRSLGEKT